MVGNIHNINNSYNAPTSKYDGTQTIGDFMNDFWTFFNKIQSGGPVDDAQMKAFLQNVNDFDAYIKANGTPSSATDPATYEVWIAINSMPIAPDTAPSSRAGWTLADYANDFATTPITVDYRDLESGVGLTNLMTFVVDPELQSEAWYVNNYTPAIQQAGDTKFMNDMGALYSDLAIYNKYPTLSHASSVLADIQALQADMANLPGGKITDGYLKVMNDFLVANGLTNVTSAAQLQGLLNTVGGTGGNTLGQDLANFVNESGAEEYGSNWNP